MSSFLFLILINYLTRIIRSFVVEVWILTGFDFIDVKMFEHFLIFFSGDGLFDGHKVAQLFDSVKRFEFVSVRVF